MPYRVLTEHQLVMYSAQHGGGSKKTQALEFSLNKMEEDGWKLEHVYETGLMKTIIMVFHRD